jgi:biotin carboxyl carrier protein
MAQKQSDSASSESRKRIVQEPAHEANQTLLHEEIFLAEAQLKEVRRQYGNGQATMADLLDQQREITALKRELAMLEHNLSGAEQAIREEMDLVARLLKEQKSRIEVGAASTGSLVGLQREMVRLRRQMAAVEAKQGSAGSLREGGPANDPAQAESNARKREEERHIHLSAPRAGVVKDVLVKEGDRVRAGQVLAQLDEEDAGIALQAARARYQVMGSALKIQEIEAREAEKEYARLKNLQRDGRISESELGRHPDIARAQLEKARAELMLAELGIRQAELEMQRLTIRAPKNGTVAAVLAQAGERVTASPKEPMIILKAEEKPSGQ